MNAIPKKQAVVVDAPQVAANDPRKPTKEELAALANGTLPLFDASSAKATRYLASLLPPRRWLFNGILQLGIVGVLVAPGGTGKSTFAIQMGVAVATGGRLAGTWDATEAGAALLLMAEDDDAELHRRVCNVADHLGLTHSDLDRLYVRSLVGQDIRLIANSREYGIETTDIGARLIATARQIDNLKLIVIDPATRWRDGDENDAGDTTKFIQAIERVSQETGATVLLIHHTNKGTINTGESSQGAARGSSALVDNARWMAQLMTVNKTINKTLKLPDDEMRQHVVLNVPKSNYAPPQPEVLLRRLDGGYLSKTEPPPKLTAPGQADDKIVALIRSEAAEGRSHSSRSFCKEFAGVDKHLGLSDHALRARLKWLIEFEKISTHKGKLQA